MGNPAPRTPDQYGLAEALREIRDFADDNPGCGYTCGQMARAALDAHENTEASR